MKKTIAPLTVLALLALAAPASAGKAVSYKGKTSSGHAVTFKVKNNRIYDLTAGVATSCLPIQGGGSPTGGPEVFGFRGSLPVRSQNTYSFMQKPAFYYNEVTMKHDLWLERSGKAAMSGRMRLQYSYLVPKFTPGTFSIYSCLGEGTFTTKARQ